MKHTECGDCKLREGDCGHHFKMDGKTNYDIASLSACDQYEDCMFFKPKAKPTGDLISREELKKAIESYDKFACLPDGELMPFRELNEPEKDYEPYVHLRDIRNAIDNAPTVEQPTGEWIEGELGYYCSKCGRYGWHDDNFCPKCGAFMREVNHGILD